MEKKLAEQLADLESSKKTFLLALTGDIHYLVAKFVEDSKISEKRTKILSWLRAASPDASTNFNKACQQHEPLTGQWLLDSTAFKCWTREEGQLLWLKGIPGAGKTIIT
jgi:hypothetical protein